MKRLTILLALSSAFGATPSSAAGGPVTQAGQPGYIQFCKDDTAVNTQFTLGDCVGYVSTLIANSNGFAAQQCDFWTVLDPAVFYDAYDSYDECVRDGASQLPF